MQLLDPTAVIALLVLVGVAALAALALAVVAVPAALRETRSDRRARRESIATRSRPSALVYNRRTHTLANCSPAAGTRPSPCRLLDRASPELAPRPGRVPGGDESGRVPGGAGSGRVHGGDESGRVRGGDGSGCVPGRSSPS